MTREQEVGFLQTTGDLDAVVLDQGHVVNVVSQLCRQVQEACVFLQWRGQC